jgi:Zn-dependent protease with chaperone function
MAYLGFLLECAAIAGLVGSASALLVFGALKVVAPLTARLSAAARGDLTLILGLLPAFTTVAMVAAAAAPSVATALGFGPDHCPGHDHHFHVCFIHSSGLRPALAAIGAFALAAWMHRLACLLKGFLESNATARKLERLARVAGGDFPVLTVPGSRLFHAIGPIRRRIIVSSDLARALTSDELTSALAHEEAHLARRDPLASSLLSAAALFVPPPIARWLQRIHRQAAEQACDAAAARRMGDGTPVAAALIKVAALQRQSSASVVLAGTAFGEHGLEGRVRALLDGKAKEPSDSRWPILALAAAVSFALLAGAGAGILHHAAETVLGHIF